MLMSVFRPVRLLLLINCLRNKLKWDPNTQRVRPRCKLHTSTLLIGPSVEKEEEKETSPDGASLGASTCSNSNFLFQTQNRRQFY